MTTENARTPPPDLADVLAARRRIRPYLRPTPLYRYPALDALTGTRAWVKHENHQPIGAFKVRGGVNLVSQLGAEERSRGVITASTGNHGQSVAYAANLFGVRAIICVPAVRSCITTVTRVRKSSVPSAETRERACTRSSINVT